MERLLPSALVEYDVVSITLCSLRRNRLVKQHSRCAGASRAIARETARGKGEMSSQQDDFRAQVGALAADKTLQEA